MARRRLAVAVLVPEPVRSEVEGLRRAVGDRQLGVVAPHVTLVPPTNVAEADLDDVLAAVRSAASLLADDLHLELGPVRTFAPDNPVLYLAVRPTEPLAAARAALGLGVLDRPDEHPFVPHVTIDIEAPPARLQAGLLALSSYRSTCPAPGLTLLEERRDRSRGRHWEPIADAACGDPMVAGRGGLELVLTAGTVVDPRALLLLEGEGRGEPRRQRHLVVTGHRDNRPVGVATGERRRAVLALTDLVVAPDERGLGVGRALVRSLVIEAAARGATRVVASRSLPADLTAFLAHLGWTPGTPTLGRDL
jgi:2'-5' RNA ligase/GNAT superfamily N-acetyltransferase